ncbi:hypothetical protein A0H76_2039 [Hepatospora eriocheir]|uniref:Uncharacterized protein n=1 Tax=Hepatospora eriocheir TaxID=1081669 RepID=A0A1X0QK94_9MICR|nr:hypothetical protein A0H76_2039 [Hepatospora eriocheir]
MNKSKKLLNKVVELNNRFSLKYKEFMDDIETKLGSKNIEQVGDSISIGMSIFIPILYFTRIID